MSAAQQLLTKLERLPSPLLAEVEDFVDFLANKSQRAASWESFLSIAPKLASQNDSPMTMDEINAEVKAVRSLRAAQRTTH